MLRCDREGQHSHRADPAAHHHDQSDEEIAESFTGEITFKFPRAGGGCVADGDIYIPLAAFDPPPAMDLLFARAMSGAKPYLHLLDTNLDTWTREFTNQ